MSNQENPGTEPGKKEFDGGVGGGEIDTGKLHENQEVDLDRSGPNEPQKTQGPEEDSNEPSRERPEQGDETQPGL